MFAFAWSERDGSVRALSEAKWEVSVESHLLNTGRCSWLLGISMGVYREGVLVEEEKKSNGGARLGGVKVS